MSFALGDQPPAVASGGDAPSASLDAQPASEAYCVPEGRSTYDIDLRSLDCSLDNYVTIKIGPKDQTLGTFILPADKLIETSAFFQRSLSAPWGGATDRTLHLPDIEVEAFDLFARWLGYGANVLIAEDDWYTEYAAYNNWRNAVAAADAEVKANRYSEDVEKKKTKEMEREMLEICPLDVWDFDFTVAAWFLGDFLCCPAFQNACMGHLYYMHNRYALEFSVYDPSSDGDEDDDNDPAISGYWHVGTVAYFSPHSILHIWSLTAHRTPSTPFELESHPLRKFMVDWLTRYWSAYELPWWDYETQEGVVEMLKECPDLMYKILNTATKGIQIPGDTGMRRLDAYWVNDGVNNDMTIELEKSRRSHE